MLFITQFPYFLQLRSSFIGKVSFVGVLVDVWKGWRQIFQPDSCKSALPTCLPHLPFPNFILLPCFAILRTICFRQKSSFNNVSDFRGIIRAWRTGPTEGQTILCLPFCVLVCTVHCVQYKHRTNIGLYSVNVHFTIKPCMLYSLRGLMQSCQHYTLSLHTMHTAHSILQITDTKIHYKLQTAHCTLHTENNILHTIGCTLHSSHHSMWPILYSSLCTLHIAHSTVQTAECTLKTAHYTL